MRIQKWVTNEFFWACRQFYGSVWQQHPLPVVELTIVFLRKRKVTVPTIRTRRRRICQKLRATKAAMAAKPRLVVKKTSTSVFLTARIPSISGWAKTIRFQPKAVSFIVWNRLAVRTKKTPAVRMRNIRAVRSQSRSLLAVQDRNCPAARSQSRNRLAVQSRSCPVARSQSRSLLAVQSQNPPAARSLSRNRPAVTRLLQAFLRLAIPQVVLRAVPRKAHPVLGRA